MDAGSLKSLRWALAVGERPRPALYRLDAGRQSGRVRSQQSRSVVRRSAAVVGSVGCCPAQRGDHAARGRPFAPCW